MTDLDNATWIERLSPPPAEAAVDRLRDILRRSLSFALRDRGDVDEADLDDFAQDATLRVLDRLSSFRAQSRFTTWAKSVAVRVALTALRRRKAHAGDGPLASLPDPGAAAPHQSERRELHEALQRSIAEALTPHQQRAIAALVSGQTVVVAAEAMELSVNAFYKLTHDARKRLKAALEAAGHDLEGGPR